MQAENKTVSEEASQIGGAFIKWSAPDALCPKFPTPDYVHLEGTKDFCLFSQPLH